MEGTFRHVRTPAVRRASAHEVREADLFFEELTGRSTGSRQVEALLSHDAWPTENYSDDLYRDGVEAQYELESDTLSTEAVSIDSKAAIPHFSNSEKANIITPLMTSTEHASALRWNNVKFQRQSGVTKAELRQALANYVDIAAVARAMSSGATIIASTSDDALVNAIHQFQRKCFVDVKQVDGKAGESTLDNLGLIARSGLRTVNRKNIGRKRFLKKKAAKINGLSNGEFTHATWFDHMLNPSFLGRRFTKGVHLHLIRTLRKAEKYLLTLPAYAGKTPVQIGTALGINEEHKGARPTKKSSSMHTLGLAADINYLTTPWIVNPGNTKGTRQFIRAMQRATRLISGWTGRVDAAYLHVLGAGGRSTASVYDELKRRSDDLRQYLALAGDRRALEAALAARRAAGTPGSYSNVASWSRDIRRDLRNLSRSGGNFGLLRDPRKGFLNHHRDLVVALRDAACMAWGAIDFGCTFSGDVMHFDVRRTSLGKVLNEKGYRTSVPCPVATTSAVSNSSENQDLMELTRTQIVDMIRDKVLETARAHRTFLSENEVRTAINSRTPGGAVDLHMNQSVAYVQAMGSVPLIGSLMERGVLWFRAMNLLVLLGRQKFKCSSTGTLSLDMAVVDAMRHSWTAANEGQTLAGLCGNTPNPCPTSHQLLHNTGNAAHFTRLSRNGIRVVELAGLWGKNLIGVSPQSHRARVSVKVLPTNAPAANVSFVAVRSSSTRHLHFGKETPRRVEAFVGSDTWKNLAVEATPGTDYQVFKRRYWEASFHRQWGKEATIEWVKGLAQFYHDRTGGVLGVGDISHIVGEDMTDHDSHERGVDIDLYGLEATPVGTTFPTSYIVFDTMTFKPLGMPATGGTPPEYSDPRRSTPVLAGAAATRVQLLYVTILAYCAATHGQLSRVIWHGAHHFRTKAVTEAQDAWDATVAAGLGTTTKPGWQSNWGPGPVNRAAISAPGSKFIGHGAPPKSNYGVMPGGWPIHDDHVHVRLS